MLILSETISDQPIERCTLVHLVFLIGKHQVDIGAASYQHLYDSHISRRDRELKCSRASFSAAVDWNLSKDGGRDYHGGKEAGVSESLVRHVV